jgi:hypothetical protein
MYIYTLIHMRINLHIYINTYPCIHTYILTYKMHTHIYDTYIHAYICIHTYIYTYIHTHPKLIMLTHIGIYFSNSF